MERFSEKHLSLGKIVASVGPRSLVFGAMAAMPLLAAGGAQASVTSGSSSAYFVYSVTNNTGQAQTQLQIVLNGNVSLGSYLDPFSSPSASASYTAGQPSVTDIAYTSTTGTSTIAAGASGVFGYTIDYPASSPAVRYPGVLGINWGAFNSSSPNIDAATIEFGQLFAAGPVVGADPYEIITATVANSSSPSQTTTEYFEAPFTGPNYSAYLFNKTGDTEIITNVGYFISNTLIPLDELNSQPNSSFTPLPSLDGTYSPNTSTPTPEAASMAMFGVGALALLLLPRRRTN